MEELVFNYHSIPQLVLSTLKRYYMSKRGEESKHWTPEEGKENTPLSILLQTQPYKDRWEKICVMHTFLKFVIYYHDSH